MTDAATDDDAIRMGKVISIAAFDRAAAPVAATEPQPAELVAIIRAIGDEAAQLDPRVLEGDAARLAGLAHSLDRCMGSALAALGALQRHDDGAREPELVFDAELDETESTPVHVLSPPRLANVCFVGGFELTRVRRELAEATDPADVLVAAETARRKLLRACRAVLDAADDVASVEPAWRNAAADLDAALVVRGLYAAFRRALRRATSEDPDAVLAAMRYAAGALATLVTSRSYEDARASDRALLRRLHERALEWARGDRGVASGLQLLDDMWTCADLLRGISRRQELRTHDTEAIRELLARAGDPSPVWLERLQSLLGIDDALDAAILEARRGAPSASLTAEIVERLVQLQ